VIALIAQLVKLGPPVVGLVRDIVRDIIRHGGANDRKAAERIVFLHAWAVEHGYPVDVIIKRTRPTPNNRQE
jgi:hypothetical protein